MAIGKNKQPVILDSFTDSIEEIDANYYSGIVVRNKKSVPQTELTDEQVDAILDSIAYKGNKLRWSRMWGSDHLRLEVPITDKRNGNPDYLGVYAMIPPYALKSAESLLKFVLSHMLVLEIHEALELFYVDGEMKFDPHIAGNLDVTIKDRHSKNTVTTNV